MSNRFSLVLGTPINKTKIMNKSALTTNTMYTINTQQKRQIGTIGAIINAPKSNSKTCGCSCGR